MWYNYEAFSLFSALFSAHATAAAVASIIMLARMSCGYITASESCAFPVEMSFAYLTLVSSHLAMIGHVGQYLHEILSYDTSREIFRFLPEVFKACTVRDACMHARQPVTIYAYVPS